jgi:hypothetical protein
MARLLHCGISIQPMTAAGHPRHFRRHVRFAPRADLRPMPAFMSTRPSVMGPAMSSLPSDRHAAELTLLSVVGAEAATLCCQKER